MTIAVVTTVASDYSVVGCHCGANESLINFIIKMKIRGSVKSSVALSAEFHV
jgi:hypothetical protein